MSEYILNLEKLFQISNKTTSRQKTTKLQKHMCTAGYVKYTLSVNILSGSLISPQVRRLILMLVSFKCTEGKSLITPFQQSQYICICFCK